MALHNLAQAYSQLPSRIVGIEDAWAAYQFDLAVLVSGRSKPERGWTGPGLTAGFRSARPYVKRKMRIPESGVW